MGKLQAVNHYIPVHSPYIDSLYKYEMYVNEGVNIYNIHLAVSIPFTRDSDLLNW